MGLRVPAAEALARAGLEPLILSFKEGLALNNGTGQMLASAILAVGRLQDLTKQADINAALALEAFCGRSAAFDPRVHQLRPHPGQIAAAANVRKLIDGSRLVDIAYHRVPRFQSWHSQSWTHADGDPRTFDVRWDYVPKSERGARSRYYQRHLPFRGGKKVQPQDAYSLRCVPQVHGAVKDTLERVREIVEIELNSVTDNPLIFPEAENGEDCVVSAGNFHGMPIALALTQLKCCIPVLASISERRLAKLVDPATNDGLPPFLIGNEDGTDSGHMIVQYTAAALVNELATKAHPATVYSLPTSANAEDHVSMGATEGRHVLEMLGDLEKVLGLELLVGTQALEFRLQILAASYNLATSLGVQALRSKLRNLSQVASDESIDTGRGRQAPAGRSQALEGRAPGHPDPCGAGTGAQPRHRIHGPRPLVVAGYRQGHRSGRIRRYRARGGDRAGRGAGLKAQPAGTRTAGAGERRPPKRAAAPLTPCRTGSPSPSTGSLCYRSALRVRDRSVLERRHSAQSRSGGLALCHL